MKAQEFLAQKKVLATTSVDARKTVLGRREALELVATVDELFALRGKKVVHIYLKKERPDDNTLCQLLLGPTGNLRAPTVKQGRKLIVGFDETTYLKILS